MGQKIDVSNWLEKNLFDALPTAAAVIDTDYNIVRVNKTFEEYFGTWKNKKCYQVYEKKDEICPHCKHNSVFLNGIPRVYESMGKDKTGRKTCRLSKVFPIKDQDGNVPYIIETTTDVSDTDQIRQKYRNLFEHVPCDVLVINRDFEVVEANELAIQRFGAIEGAHCYQILKNRANKCLECTAQHTFNDGQRHSGRSTVIGKDGKRVELLVTTVPYEVVNGQFDLVLEMAIDITEARELQDELKMTSSFMQSLISSSIFGIIAVDEQDDITIFNDSAKSMLKIDDVADLEFRDLARMFPEGFLETVSSSSGPVIFRDIEICNGEGDKFPASLTGINLVNNKQYKGKAFWIRDTSRVKRLEAEKLEVERLAAVGKTVAGLAHGIKNVLTGLEGGEYMLNSGLRKGDAARIQKGMEMLNRNTQRVSTFVKEFLSFSKGQEVETTICNPVAIAQDVVNIYSVKVKQLGIKLVTDFEENMANAPMHCEGIHESLSNILGNAIDACQISENRENLQIMIRAFEEDGNIIYEIADNGCGMDYEVKKKVFTTFFTTKGLGGTGLGLLMTKKIIQQHGGKVEFESILDQGTTFKITLPRERLPEPMSSKPPMKA